MQNPGLPQSEPARRRAGMHLRLAVDIDKHVRISDFCLPSQALYSLNLPLNFPTQ